MIWLGIRYGLGFPERAGLGPIPQPETYYEAPKGLFTPPARQIRSFYKTGPGSNLLKVPARAELVFWFFTVLPVRE